MKIKNILLFNCILALNFTFAQNAPTDASSAGRAFLTGLTEENTQVLNTVIGNDFRLLSFDGQMIDAGTLLEGISGGHVVIESGNIYNHYTRHFQDTGVVTGIWDVRGSIEGQSFSNRLVYTLVVVKQGGLWKVVSVQFTPS
ncbi:MAG: nuclear transport factor 2 family protein [Spirosomataceae bacterium]